MAYRGSNLLLREQRRADLDRLGRMQQYKDIQQAIGAAEDIRNRQFEREQKQAALRGQLAQQLDQQRSPFEVKPYEEAAELGAMSARVGQQKSAAQQEAEKRKQVWDYQTKMNVQGLRNEGQRRAALIRTHGGKGGGFKDMLENSINAAELNMKQAHKSLMALKEPSPWGTGASGSKEEILAAEQAYQRSQMELFRLSNIADKVRMGKSGEALAEFVNIHSQKGTPPSQQTQPVSQHRVVPQPKPRPITEAPPLESYTDPVAQSLEREKRTGQETEKRFEDFRMQTGGEGKVEEAREGLAAKKNERLDRLEVEATFAHIKGFGPEKIEELAMQWTQGGRDAKGQVKRIVDTLVSNDVITKDQWSNALDNIATRPARQGPSPLATPAPQGGMPVAETPRSSLQRKLKERLK